MENSVFYKMMITNASKYVENFDPLKTVDFIPVWQISEVLAICTGKLKEDIVTDIVELLHELTFNERVKLFNSIWGIEMVAVDEHRFDFDQIKHYYDSNPANIDCVFMTKFELQTYIDSAMFDKITEDSNLYKLLTRIMDYNKVPKVNNEIQYYPDNQRKKLNQYTF